MIYNTRLKNKRLNKKRGEICYEVYRDNKSGYNKGEFTISELAKLFNLSEKSFYRIIIEHRKKDWSFRNPEKVKASEKLRKEIREGKIQRPTKCQKCGEKYNGNSVINGHHEDYSKPLEVIWLCNACHKKLHTQRSMANKIKNINK